MKWLTEIGMFGSGLCYVVAAIGWYAEGRTWMAITYGLYFLTAVTLYYAGRT